MKKLIIFTICTTYSLSVFATKTNTNITTKQQLQKIINTAIVKYHLPSLTISYKIPHEPTQTIHSGYRTLQPLKKINGNALYQVGSITKSFTSVIILHFQKSGKLSIDDKLAKYAYPHTQLKKWINAYPAFENITIRQILNHSSGAPAALNTPLYTKLISKNPGLCYSPNYLMKNIVFKQKPFFKPGHGYHYTNTDYMLASALIQAVSGKSYHHNMTQLLNKAGFKKHTYYIPKNCNSKYPNWLIKRIPNAYMPSDSDFPKPEVKALSKGLHVKIPGNSLVLYDVTQVARQQLETGISSGGLITNTKNLAHWYELLFEKHFISNQSLKDFTQGIPTPYGYKYGLGITVRYLKKFKDTSYSHDGSLSGYRANDIFLKNHHIILALTTNASNGAVELNTPLVDDILKILIASESNHSHLNK